MPLLKTKLNTPPRRPNMVVRPRLLRRLDEALRLGCRLILVSAKAGAGKTTLVSEWLGQKEQRTTWLSLDANDNDPGRFFAYLMAALDRVKECLDHISILNQTHLRSVLNTFIDYYNTARPHQGLEQQSPIPCHPKCAVDPGHRQDVLGGIIGDYYRAPDNTALVLS